MADTVTGPEVLQENDKRVTLKIVVESDGDGSTTVFFDSSARTVNGVATKAPYKEYGFHVPRVMVLIHLHV